MKTLILLTILNSLFVGIQPAHGQEQASAQKAPVPADLVSLAEPEPLSAPSLSVGGQWVAALVYEKSTKQQKLTVWFDGKGIASGDQLPYAFEEIDWYAWVGGARLVIALKGKGLVAYDAAIRALSPTIEQGPKPFEKPVTLLATIPGDPNRFLVSFTQLDGDFPAVFEIAIAEKTATKIIDPFPPVRRWWSAADGSVALGEGFRDGKKLLYRQGSDGGWERYLDRDLLSGPTLRILAVARGGRQIYVAEAHGNEGVHALKRYSLGDATTAPVLYQSPTGEDVRTVLFDPATGFLVGATIGATGPLGIPLDPWLDALQALLPEEIAPYCRPISEARVRRKLLVACAAPGRPIAYWLVNLDTNSARPMLPDNPTKPSYTVTSFAASSFNDKDAAPYIMAVGTATQKGDILWVHGGPHSQATGDFDATIAYLTSEGYRVFMPNFVGSTGYGDNHERKGWGGWGAAMQVSLYTTAMAIQQKHGQQDPSAFYVMGISYGGFSSLLMAAERPDLTRCSISINGVTNLPKFFAAARGANDFYKNRFLGNTAEKDLFARSPIARIQAKQAPVLLIHGAGDRIVSPSHMEDYKAQTRRAFIPARFTLIEGADHGFTNPLHRVQLWQRISAFLDRCDR